MVRKVYNQQHPIILMWLVPTKKDLNRELEKIKEAFQERDIKIEKLKEQVESHSLKLATIEGAYSLISKDVNTSKILPDSFESKLLKKIRHNKKSFIMSEIMKLLSTHDTQSIFEVIVLEKKLCSKASFYRHIKSLKEQKLITPYN